MKKMQYFVLTLFFNVLFTSDVLGNEVRKIIYPDKQRFNPEYQTRRYLNTLMRQFNIKLFLIVILLLNIGIYRCSDKMSCSELEQSVKEELNKSNNCSIKEECVRLAAFCFGFAVNKNSDTTNLEKTYDEYLQNCSPVCAGTVPYGIQCNSGKCEFVYDICVPDDCVILESK